MNDAAAFWADPKMFTASLLALFTAQYGTEAYVWEPATIQMEIEQDNGIEIPGPSFDRLMTGISLLTTNSFFASLPDFARTCAVLSGHFASADAMLLPDCAELAWGITEALLIAPPEPNNPNPFDAEILGYIGQALDSEGIINPPDVLRLGVRDPRPQAETDWSDDPEMFSAIWKFEQEKTEEIENLVKTRVQALFVQLQSLPGLQAPESQKRLASLSRKFKS